MTQKIIKTGNSAAVTIPVEIFDALCLRYGDPAEATLDSEAGTITYRFPNGRQLPLSASESAGETPAGKTRRVKTDKPDGLGNGDDATGHEGKENEK